MYDFIMLDNKLKTHKNMLPMEIVKERINRLQIETIPTYILIIENLIQTEQLRHIAHCCDFVLPQNFSEK